MQIFNITPMGKPRQTRADKWKQREVVLRYRAFCDEVRLKKVVMPEAGSHITFILPMPASWSQKKRVAMNGQAHQQKPDADNMIKALMDALFADDAHKRPLSLRRLRPGTGPQSDQRAGSAGI